MRNRVRNVKSGLNCAVHCALPCAVANHPLLMENLTLPLKRSRSYYKNRRPINLNLDKDLTKVSTARALERYGFSLSEMVNRLLQIEYSHKNGLLNKKWDLTRKL